MSRRNRATKREQRPDSRYGSPVVNRLISTIMKSGKRSTAEKIVYGAIDKTNEKSETIDPLGILLKAIENVKPRLEVKSRRVGGATYQVPMEVAPERGLALAMRWIVGLAAKRRGSLINGLANELRDAAAGQGGAIKKRDDVHKMAQANRAFAHLRW